MWQFADLDGGYLSGLQAQVLEIPPVVTDREWVDEWADRLEDLLLEVGQIFPRAELRRRAAGGVRGLLGLSSRKNGWQLAEYAGDARPHGQQHLLDRSCWDVDELRDAVRRYVVAGLDDDGRNDDGGAGPAGAGALVVDETGFAKKGRASAGVARQYTGTLGGVFPCQVGVMAAWATGRGQALIDRELYLPQERTDDAPRCRVAHIPDTVGFATKPRLAEQMIEPILPDLPAGRVWVVAEEVYGRDGAFWAFCEEHDLPYAVAVPADQTVLARPGRRHLAGLVERCAAEGAWVDLPAGPSQLDSRAWQWWVRRILGPDHEIGEGAWARWVIARRRPQEPDQRDYSLAWGPPETSVEALVRVPGARWRVEEAIKLATSVCGLADDEVRSWRGWYRHITLTQLAAAFLAVQAAHAAGEHGDSPPPACGGERVAAVRADQDDRAHRAYGVQRV